MSVRQGLWVILLLSFYGGTSYSYPLKQREGPCRSPSHRVSIPNEVPTPVHKRKKKQPKKKQALKSCSLKTQLDYARNGHNVLRDFIPPSTLHPLRNVIRKYCHSHELSAYQQKVQVAADTDKTEASKLAAEKLAQSCTTVQQCQEQLRGLLRQTSDVSLPFLQYFNLWKDIPDVLDLARSLAETAAVLMDVRSVRLYQDAVFWKRRQDGCTPWHTDARMAPFDTNHFCTIWIPLHSIDRSGLIFCSKTHADVALPYWTDNIATSNLEDRYRYHEVVHYLPMSVGDVTVHSGWTLHTADPAVSSDRIALAISFVDSLAPVRSDLASGDREDWSSYASWIDNVPRETAKWNHQSVPILWPPRSGSPPK